jgi:putative membrane protein
LSHSLSRAASSVVAEWSSRLAAMRRRDAFPLTLLLVDAIALVASSIHAKDRLTWWLEIAPFLIALPALVLTYRRMRLTNLVYALIALHACVLFVGGHYTYAEVPLGFWAEHVFGWSRNNYDRLGHFFQGFVPALVTREVLLRATPLRRGGWLFFLTVCVCLASSALYELLEWRVAVGLGQSADAFLGTQGDPWDTQEDMATALVGAILALLVLSRVQDRALLRQSDSGETRSSPSSREGDIAP